MQRPGPTKEFSSRHCRRIKAARVSADMNEIMYGTRFDKKYQDSTKLSSSQKPMDVDVELDAAIHMPQQDDDGLNLLFENERFEDYDSFPYDEETDTSSDSGEDVGNDDDNDCEWFDCSEDEFHQVPVDSQFNNDDTTFLGDVSTEEDERSHRSKRTKHAISVWALAFGIPHKALTVLLLILRSQTDLILPRDSRALLQTPRNVDMIDMPGGAEYCHFGLKKAVEEIARHYKKRGILDREIRLIFNIDGLPIYKSSEKSLWLILCSDTVLKKVYIVGIYIGSGKPKDPNNFLDHFVNEAAELCGSTQIIDGQDFTVHFHALVCDAPAKSMVLNTAGHSGYNSCSKCTQSGTWEVPPGRKVQGKGRVCFPLQQNDPNIRLRTDEEFSSNSCGKYQHGNTSLLRIPGFSGVKRVPLDYLHLVLLGAMKRLIRLWLKGPRINRLGRQAIARLTAVLLALAKTTPDEFSRRARAIDLFHFWKATEFRSFLLYIGPAVLKGILPDELYDNFIMLHVAITILISRDLVSNPENVNIAEKLLIAFVGGFQNIYGKEHMSHNIHNLLHLAADVRIFGSLDEFSAFRFENYMTVIKRYIRKYDKPVQQISKRSHEFANADKLNEEEEHKLPLKDCHFNGPLCDLPTEVLQQFKRFVGDNFTIDCGKEKDNAICLVDRTVVNVSNIVKCTNGDIFLIGRQYTDGRDLYCNGPVNSSQINIAVYDNESLSHIKSWPLTDFHRKMWKIPMKNGTTLCSPLSHCLIDTFLLNF